MSIFPFFFVLTISFRFFVQFMGTSVRYIRLNSMSAVERTIKCRYLFTTKADQIKITKQEAFEKCWAHSPLRAAARPFTRCRYCRTPPAHRCPRRRQQRQRQRVTEGTAMAQ